MIRVAQVMGYMDGGGVEQVVMNYYRHIDRSRVQFDFLVCEGSGMVPREEIESMGGRVLMVPPYKELPRYMRETERLFREESWPIVHSHVNALSVFPLRAAKRAGVPVRIAHSHSTAGKGETAKNAVKSVLKRFTNVYPTHRMACSRYAGEWLFGKGADFEVVYNAIDLSLFRPREEVRASIRGELGVSDGTFVLGHIGRVVPQKNQKRLLSIFRALLDIEPDSLLVLVGDGPLMGQLKVEAERLGIMGRTRFLGQRQDTFRLYQAFDAFCLPSVYEGLPVVGIECQASGTPILASTEVSSEAAACSLMEFEPLSSSDGEWACHLLSLRDRTLSQADKEGLRVFDIVHAARDLETRYHACIDGLGEVHV